jgi:uncharacterized protein YtpQ (UPF0354 family)
MKNVFLILFFLSTSVNIYAQQLKSLINKAKETTGISQSKASQPEIIAGLKEALSSGVTKGVSELSMENGFWGNPLYKIVMPPEAQRVEKALRGIGLGAKVDEAMLSMNKGAEDAMKNAAPIFMDAIRGMEIKDAIQILRGPDTAATAYLRTATTLSLSNSFRPVIQESLEKSGAAKHWTSLMTSYNKISLQKVNTDLAGYVTEKALQAVFRQIAEQEKQIRIDPAARTTSLLKKVFEAK